MLTKCKDKSEIILPFIAIKARKPLLVFISLCIVALAGCGGGGGGGSSDGVVSGGDSDTGGNTAEADTVSPDVPQQVIAQAQSSSTIGLSWQMANDNVMTTGYRIFRESVDIAVVTETQFVDSELSASTVYTYTVVAFDASGNESGGSDSAAATTLADADTGADAGSAKASSELIGNAFSGTSIGLSWLDSGDTYTVYRDGAEVAQTSDNFYIDTQLNVNTSYTYSVTTGDVENENETSTVAAKTLVNSTNDGTNNGAETVIINDRISNFSECNNELNALTLADTDLDTCLRAMLNFNSMAGHLEDMRAFAARVRSEQAPAMVELGMKLFHSKSLSANADTSCSSCHHPALGCGGDDLSMPIGVNAVDPALLGPGRSDGMNSIPIVPRNSQATCNTALWTRGLFWDNRVAISGRSLTTESADVTANTDASVGDSTIALLMAQAHFPVTAAAEMGDATEFGYDDTVDSDLTAYRETVLAGNLSLEAWGQLFTAAFGDATITYSRIAEAMAAYEAVQIFIDNPFFDYVDGNTEAISEDEKRGAITFMASSTGCTFCHAGAFFSTQAQLPGNYPQIGVGKDEGGSGADEGAEGLTGPGAFRAPTLLNVAITGPWGHNGQFGTLKRNVEHYKGHGDSIAQYFANKEMCELEQFADLADCENELAPNGLALSEAILAGNQEFSNNISDQEVDLVVKFLETLTDPDAANTSSSAIQSLIPARDGGPDGNQLDAIDQYGNALSSYIAGLTPGFNDTGLTWGGSATSGNNSSCAGDTIAEQDCSQGRDSTHNDDSDGHGGFSFSKLDANGSVLASSALDWNCVRDNVTGLIWEVKTTDGGIHDHNTSYRWGGVGAEAFGNEFYEDWNVLVNGSNSEALCGYSDWRVPHVNELEGIVSLDRSNPAIDTDYFPNTVLFGYLSKNASVSDSSVAWYVHFTSGWTHSNALRDNSASLKFVRLVRGGD